MVEELPKEEIDKIVKQKDILIKKYGKEFYDEHKLIVNLCPKCNTENFYFSEDCSNCDEFIGDKIQEDWFIWKQQQTKEHQNLSNENVDLLLGLQINNYYQNIKIFHQMKPFFYDKSGLFWFWNKKDTKYELVDEIDIMNELDNSCKFHGATVNNKLKTQYIESFKRIGRERQPKEAPSKWIQFQNKAYSIKSKEIYNVKPNYFFTNPIPWSIGKSSDTPVIDKLLIDWVGEKYKEDMYEIIAYCCLRDYPIQTLICFHGSGRNGKSQFMKLLIKFLGEDNICSTELDRLANPLNRFESFKLYKKLMCSMGETNFGTLNNTSMLKKLVGGDMIDYEVKNKSPFNNVNYAKIIIGSNSLPSTSDTSDGYMRRWYIIDFPNEFKEGKDIINSIPEQEYNNLAKKVIEILPKLLERGEFSHRGTIEERKRKYISVSNPLSIFIEENCEKDINNFISYNELYTSYVGYLNENKKRRVSRKEFRSVLEDEGFWLQRTSKEVTLKNGEKQYKSDQWIEGINLCVNYVNYVKNPNQPPHSRNEVRNVPQITYFTQNNNTKKDINIIKDTTDIVLSILKNLGGKEENISYTLLYEKVESELADKCLDILKEKGEVFEPKMGFLRLL